MEKTKLGIIGFSEGNGHPYSWSAICNGFDRDKMKDCGFPSIPEYLQKQRYPEDFIADAQVTHVWTQDKDLSRKIAAASRIGTVTEAPEEMIGEIDALLLARDDAENHLALARPFLAAGLPVYVDKPVALSRHGLDALRALEKYSGQIFTCSALRFSADLSLGADDRKKVGELRHIRGFSPKYWDTYSVHLFESVVSNFPSLGRVSSSSRFGSERMRGLHVTWESGVTGIFECTGTSFPQGIQIGYCGSGGIVTKNFNDSFFSFRESIKAFLAGIRAGEPVIPAGETELIVDLIECGRLSCEP